VIGIPWRNCWTDLGYTFFRIGGGWGLSGEAVSLGRSKKISGVTGPEKALSPWKAKLFDQKTRNLKCGFVQICCKYI